MKLKPNDVVRWDGEDGILLNGTEYLIGLTKKGKRGQEFVLNHWNGKPVEPVTWWERGEPYYQIKEVLA